MSQTYRSQAEAGLRQIEAKGYATRATGTRSCQKGVTNLLSLLWQGRGHEA